MTDINPIIADRFTDHLDVFSKTMDQMDVIQEIANRCIVALNSGNKILFCGNGGSAADSQHLAAELIGRFKRTPLSCIHCAYHRYIYFDSCCQ